MRRARHLMAAAAVWLAASATGRAEPTRWVVAPERSEIAVAFTLNGKEARGVFQSFSGSGRFAPDAPERAELEIRIDAASIDLGIALFSAYAGSEEWFFVEAHPEVVFRLDRLEPDGDGYRAIGALTIRGVTLPARGRLGLEVAGDEARARGALAVDREAYNLGLGPSSVLAEISEYVDVRFDLAARRAPDID